MDNRDIVKSFYGCISGGDAAGLEKLVDENFELIVPNAGGVLTGRYIGKARFMADIIGTVFGCVNPEDIVFAKMSKSCVRKATRWLPLLRMKALRRVAKVTIKFMRILQQSGMEKLPS